MLLLASLLCTSIVLSSSAPIQQPLQREDTLCTDGLCFAYPESCPLLDCRVVVKMVPQDNNFAKFFISADRESHLDKVLMLSVSDEIGSKRTFTCYPDERRVSMINEVDNRMDEIGSAEFLSADVDDDLLQCELVGQIQSASQRPIKYAVSLASLNVNTEYQLYQVDPSNPWSTRNDDIWTEREPQYNDSPVVPSRLPVALALESGEEKRMPMQEVSGRHESSIDKTDPKDQAEVQREKFVARNQSGVSSDVDDAVERNMLSTGSKTTVLLTTMVNNTSGVNGTASITAAPVTTSSAKSTESPNTENEPASRAMNAEEDSNIDEMDDASTTSQNSTITGTTFVNGTSAITTPEGELSLRSMDTEHESDGKTSRKTGIIDAKNSTSTAVPETSFEKSDPDDDIMGDSGSTCSLGSVLLTFVAALFIYLCNL